jgi:hypothetical protein
MPTMTVAYHICIAIEDKLGSLDIRWAESIDWSEIYGSSST